MKQAIKETDVILTNDVFSWLDECEYISTEAYHGEVLGRHSVHVHQQIYKKE